MENSNGEGPLQFLYGLPSSLYYVPFSLRLDEVADYLAICFGPKFMSLALKPLAKREEVIDIAVVDYGQVSGAVLVGMGISSRDASYSCPTGVGDAQGALEVFHLMAAFFYRAHLFGNLDTLSVE